MKLKDACSLKKSYDQLRPHILKQRHYFANKSLFSQSCGFSSIHLWMWELDNKEKWVPKNWCFWTLLLAKTVESPLEYKENQPVNPKGIQSWIFIQRLKLKLKLQYLGHLMQRSDSLEKTLVLGMIDSGRRVVDRGWVGWMASLTWWTWVWVCSRNWWRTEKPVVLHSMASQRVGHDWVTELYWAYLIIR